MAAQYADDSCRWANDNECDEPRYGSTTNACVDGSDTTDCGGVLTVGGVVSAFGNQTETPRVSVDDLMALLPQGVRTALGDDSCQYANDHECDDAAYGGTGACQAGTDATDCRALAIGGDDSCQYANDNECDEIGIGLGYCGSGTDTTDCAAVTFLRNRTDSCQTAFNGVCDEPTNGNGSCSALSDTADCVGRGRPANMQDHYFGRDDRYLPDLTQLPFRAIGLLEAAESACTGTLVGPNLVLTAAHCLTDGEGNEIEQVSFFAGFGPAGSAGSAGITQVVYSPNYSNAVANPGEGNGNDWGVVVLDRNLGDKVGYLNVHVLEPGELAQITSGGLLVDQSGYSHDTSPNQSANRGCRLTQAFDDNSVIHECDTAQGDSGSPFILEQDGVFSIIAVDSQFFDPESKNSVFDQGNLAVDSRAFADTVARMLAEQSRVVQQ